MLKNDNWVFLIKIIYNIQIIKLNGNKRFRRGYLSNNRRR